LRHVQRQGGGAVRREHGRIATQGRGAQADVLEAIGYEDKVGIKDLIYSVA
jgi:hypothetical protein